MIVPLGQPVLSDSIAGGRSVPDNNGVVPPGGDGKPLLRTEVIRQMAQRGLGSPVAKLPSSWAILSGLLLTMLAFLILFLAFNNYSRKETVRGILQSASGEVNLSVPDPGVITRVNVTEGDFVKAGDILVVVSTDRTSASGTSVQAELMASLAAQQRSIEERLGAISADDSLNDSLATAQIQSAQADLAAARSADSATAAQYAIVKEQYDIAKPSAEKGFLSKSEFKRRELAVIVARQAMADALGRLTSLTSQIEGLRAAAAKRPFDTIKERGVLQDTLADLRQRQAQYRMSQGYSVRAPATGRITTMQANIGQHVDPVHPLMAIVPQKAVMRAALYVGSEGIGQLRAGQRVRIRYDAFPFETFGAAEGTIRYVSQTVLRPEEVSGAIQLNQPTYKVLVDIKQQSVEGYGRRFRLLPGMSLSADITLQRRSLGEWLLEPLIAAGRNQ